MKQGAKFHHDTLIFFGNFRKAAGSFPDFQAKFNF